MTHDELLVKLEQRYWKMFNHNSTDQSDSGTEHRILIQQSYFALQKVVEMHKPHEHIQEYGSGGLFCFACQLLYPCFTIQAIEKELA